MSALILCLVLGSFCLTQLVHSQFGLQRINSSSLYSYEEVDGDTSVPSVWVDIKVNVINQDLHTTLLRRLLPHPVNGTRSLTEFVSQPVYISLTTISHRFEAMNSTIINILQGVVVPTKIFLVVSKDPFLLDKGITHISDDLLCLVAAGHLNIVLVPNHGPHRKLLPVLRKYWKDDVYIATVDDDVPRVYMLKALYNLLRTYQLSNYTQAVVALRSRRITVCNKPPHHFSRYKTWQILEGIGKVEMVVVPTGFGSILYRPRYFHEVVFSSEFRNATRTADDLTFRLATMMNKVPVLNGCGGTDMPCPARRHIPHAPVHTLHQSTNHNSKRNISHTTHNNVHQGDLDSTPVRRLSNETVKEKPLILAGLNVQRGNDFAWSAALEVLRPLGFDFETFAESYLHERGESCFPPDGSVASIMCGLVKC